ncbi:MAG: hypothetical protein FD139_746 [Methylocystaceae bacterium]|nr:MAG: hypothetical protein FD148_63 [Methylocystaceae bacterium]KAF0213996.1 MAG: hypothetical protein FD172_120 [Methylocystaceae bacterium]TXT46901.1 MAG: hypothetical protein FD139_746 [Methylocystaceae bacterium]
MLAMAAGIGRGKIIIAIVDEAEARNKKAPAK